MLILGVDPGTRILGYSLLQTDPTPHVEMMDVLMLKNIADYQERIRTIFFSMQSLMEQHRPSHLAIEAPFFGKNVQSMLKLGRAQGVTIAAALSLDIPYTEYEPAVIKQHITGNGTATKEQVQSLLSMHLGVELTPRFLDATDALAAAYCHYLSVSSPTQELRQLLKPHTRRRSKAAAWSDFIEQNPDRVEGNNG